MYIDCAADCISSKSFLLQMILYPYLSSPQADRRKYFCWRLKGMALDIWVDGACCAVFFIENYFTERCICVSQGFSGILAVTCVVGWYTDGRGVFISQLFSLFWVCWSIFRYNKPWCSVWGNWNEIWIHWIVCTSDLLTLRFSLWKGLSNTFTPSFLNKMTKDHDSPLRPLRNHL